MKPNAHSLYEVARRYRTLGALALLLPTTGACYTYARVPLDAAPVGQDVRMVVDRAGVPQIDDVVPGDDAAPQLRGHLEGQEGSTLLLRVPVQGNADPMTSTANISQLLRVPADEVLQVEIESFSAARSGLLAAGVAALGAFVVLAIIDAGSESDGLDDPNPELSIGVFSIPIG